MRRAVALHLTQPPARYGSKNDWHLHLLRLKEVGHLERDSIDGH